MRHNKINSMSQDRYVVRNVTLWNADGVTGPLDIAIKDGIVLKIAGKIGDLSAESFYELDAKGLVIMPAGVDAQVHLRVPGQAQKETAWSGSWAAVAGGVGAMLTMPNTKPVLDNLETLELARREVMGPSAATGVKILFSAAITKNQHGKECVDFEALAKAGVAAFTDDGVGVASDHVMQEAVMGAAKTGLPLLQHAEVPGHGGVLADGPIQRSIGGTAYPESAETDMVRRDIELLKNAPKARYHVLHVSSSKTLELIDAAKKKGYNVSCEASPHHLYFTSEDIVPTNSAFKMNPPLRSAVDRSLLQSALASGQCDFVATDHAPHEAQVKTENFRTSAFGTTGLETSLRALIGLWQKGVLSPKRLVEVWSTAPAKFLGVSVDYGSISEGRPFNAVLCDVKSQGEIVSEGDFVGQSKNSCFIGYKLPGRIVATLLSEKIHQLV